MSQESQHKDFKSFQEFYPFYLSQHENGKCRALHFIGSWIVLGIIAAGIISGVYWYLLFIPIAGYGFAWIGHFVFEKNKPATFTNPWYSLMGDWVMFWEILTGKIKLH